MKKPRIPVTSSSLISINLVAFLFVLSLPSIFWEDLSLSLGRIPSIFPQSEPTIATAAFRPSIQRERERERHSLGDSKLEDPNFVFSLFHMGELFLPLLSWGRGGWRMLDKRKMGKWRPPPHFIKLIHFPRAARKVERENSTCIRRRRGVVNSQK